jgi:uncharacterized protein (UPF0218 family)
MPWHKGQMALERGGGKKLLSAAYKDHLGKLVNEQMRKELKLPEGSTWADAIAAQVMLRSVGLVSKEKICFTAITEIRESTEGKTAERIVAAGNEELAALARAMTGEPAPDLNDNPSTSDD